MNRRTSLGNLTKHLTLNQPNEGFIAKLRDIEDLKALVEQLKDVE